MKRITRTLAGALISTTALIGATAIEVGAATASTVNASQVVVRATEPTALTVAGHRGLPVTVWTRGTAPITMRPLNTRPITFNGLLAGRSYAVYVGSERATTARTMGPIGAITNATATPGAKPRTLDVRWRHSGVDRATSSTIRYLVSAVNADGTRVRTVVQGRNRAQLTGIDATRGARVSITPYVAGSRGTGVVITASNSSKATAAAPQEPTETGPDAAQQSTPTPTSPEPKPQIAEVTHTATPEHAGTPVAAAPAAAPAAAAAPATARVIPAPVPAPTPPTPASAPAPAPIPAAAPAAPATRLTCPDGWTDAGSECTQTSPYSYTTRAYTFHRGIVGSVSVGECWIPNSTTGAMEYFANCSEYVYGDVRDATPSGFEDTGSQWRKKDPAPSGWTDTGIGYQRTTAKVTVPA